LGYGLDFGLEEVLSVLKISSHGLKRKNKKENNVQIPQINDA
jgi:hypothetical protein